MRRHFFFLLFLSVCLSAFSRRQKQPQEPITGMNEVVSVDSIENILDQYTRIQLPPLAVFLESAYTHPSVGIYESLRDEQNAELKNTQREWLNYLSLSGQYQYGHMLALSSVTASDIPLYYTSNGQKQQAYNAGVRMTVPVGDLLGGQKQKVRVQKARLRRIEYEYEISIEERKLKILEAYNQVIQELAVLKAKSDAAALYNAQMKISEQEFINGKIDISSLSMERSRRTSAIVTYQEGKAALQNAITRLEMLTSVKILNR